MVAHQQGGCPGALGILIGLLVSVTLSLHIWLVLAAASKAKEQLWRLIGQFTLSVSTVIGIMLGGSWMSNYVLDLNHLKDFSEFYTGSLAVTVWAIIAYPLICLERSFGRIQLVDSIDAQ
jgi:hypothetical protein